MQNIGRTWQEHVLPMFWACSFHGNSMNNFLSYCGLVVAKISASEKDLPVKVLHTNTYHSGAKFSLGQ